MSTRNYGNQSPTPPANYPYASQRTSAYPADRATAAHAAGTHASNFDTAYAGPRADAYQTPSLEQPAYAGSYESVQAVATPKKHGFGKTFLAGFLGAALACSLAGGGFAAYSAIHDDDNGASATGSTTVLGAGSNHAVNASDDDDRAEVVADKVLPSVVGIDIYTNTGGSTGWGSLFDSGSDSLTYSGLGSGVIISADGYILTNHHVVDGADALKVNAGGTQYDAQIVGVDESSDLAVIKVDAEGLTPIEIGSSADLVPGQWVMTVGSPFGLEQSVATGIVSATSRTVTVQNASADPYSYYFGEQSAGDVSIYSNMIQTDAAINPGNSGGALVDGNGQLIGINAVIESYSGSYSGVGFAIPVDYAMNIAEQIIEGKTPTHAQLGVSCTTITNDIASRYNLDASEGAYVSAVYEGSAASDSGLKEGDIITAVDDTEITNSTDLVAACRSHQVGDQVTITFMRDGQEQTVDVTLGSDEETLATELPAEEGVATPEGEEYGPGFGFDFGFGQNYDGAQDGLGLDSAA